MKKLSVLFNQAKKERQALFVAYLTAGDPNLQGTMALVEGMARDGVDVIELGIPFSDPVADGPVNQRAAERALRQGTTLKGVLSMVRDVRRRGLEIPIVIFSYVNPIFQMGFETFAKTARKSGVSGVLVVDLPPEEGSGFNDCLRKNGLESIFLAAPTTSPARLAVIQAMSSGFVYYVSRTGVTGTRSDLSGTLKQELITVRESIQKPIAVGFGISTPEQVRRVATLAEGVVVGSAIVEVIERGGIDVRQTTVILSRLLKPMIKAAHGEKPC